MELCALEQLIVALRAQAAAGFRAPPAHGIPVSPEPTDPVPSTGPAFRGAGDFLCAYA